MSLQSALSLNQCWPYRTTGKIWAAMRHWVALMISTPAHTAVIGENFGKKRPEYQHEGVAMPLPRVIFACFCLFYSNDNSNCFGSSPRRLNDIL